MKKTTAIALLLFSGIITTQAQVNWGIKGGLNYNSNGDIIHEIDGIIDDGISTSSNDTGFHLGVFATTKGPVFYLRPELVYTKTKSEYDEGNFGMSKLDMPLLLGFKIVGPLSILAGPSLQYILDTDLEGFSLSDVEKNFTVGLNIGAAVHLGKLGFDIRYERGFTNNEAKFLNLEENIGSIDTRPEQLILSVSFKL